MIVPDGFYLFTHFIFTVLHDIFYVQPFFLKSTLRNKVSYPWLLEIESIVCFETYV